MRTKRSRAILRGMALSALVVLAFACDRDTTTSTTRRPKPRPAGAAKTATIPDPQAVSVPNAVMIIQINRLDQVLPKIEALVAQIVPNFTSENIKAQIGSQLGDPTLANLDQTRSIVLCAFDPPGADQPSMVGLLPVTSDQYKARFQAMGMIVHQEEKGGKKTLLVTDKEQAAVAGRQAFAQLEPLLSQPMTNDLSVYVDVDTLMTRHAADIDTGIAEMSKNLAQMQEMMGQPGGAMKILEMELAGFVSAVKEIKDVQFDVAIAKQGVEAGGVVRAKAGTPMEKAFQQDTIPDISLLSYVPAEGAIVGCAGGDSTAFAEFIAGKIDEAVRAVPMGPDSKLKPEALKKMITETMGLMTSMAFSYLQPDKGSLNGVLVMETSDPKAYEDYVLNMEKHWQEAGLLDLYSNMGMDFKVSVTRNVRQYNGVQIHKYVQDFTMPQMAEMPPQMAMIMKNFMHMEYEIAMVDKYCVYDMGTGKLDGIIAALKAKKPLSTAKLDAQSVFPQQGDLYVDINPGRLASWGIKMAETIVGQMLQANPQVAKAVESLKTLKTTSVSLYMSSHKGKLQAKLFVPIQPIVQIKKIVEEAMAPPMPVVP